MRQSMFDSAMTFAVRCNIFYSFRVVHIFLEIHVAAGVLNEGLHQKEMKEDKDRVIDQRVPHCYR